MTKQLKNILIPVDSVTGEMFSYPECTETKFYDTREKTKHGFTIIYVSEPRKSSWMSEEEYKNKTDEYNKNLELINEGLLIKVTKWIDNHIFKKEMTVDHVTRGRSSAKFILIDEKGIKYEMFLKGFSEMIKKTTIKKGKVAGKWCYVKRGANYGIEFVD